MCYSIGNLNKTLYFVEKGGANMDKASTIAFEVYPDSLPPQFPDIESIASELCSRGYQGAISPLHTPPNGKKPHYHIMLVFENARSIENISDFSQTVFNGTHAIVIANRRVYYRYLVHLDNPEKQQFDGEVPFDFGGMDGTLFLLDCHPRVIVFQFIEQHNISTFRGLCQELVKNDMSPLLDYVEKNPYFITQFLRY